MRVIITGGTGFIGQLVAREILRRGALRSHVSAGGSGLIDHKAKVTSLVLADVSRPATLMSGLEDAEYAISDGFCSIF